MNAATHPFVGLERAIFALGNHVRYFAFGSGPKIHATERDDLDGSSDAGSDFYEELLVNPALVLLARQRGDLDCGGLRHLVVAYGNFTQIVVPTAEGHVSVCLERDADAHAAADEIVKLVQQVNV